MARRIFYGWWVVAAAVVGLGTGVTTLMLWTFGVFLKPLTAEFGWTRTEYSAAVLFSTAAIVLASPLVGRLVDRHGARRVAVPSFVLLAAAFACMAFLGPRVAQLHAMFAVCAVLGSGTTAVVYSRVVSCWFDRRRGLALGLALAGIGGGAFVLPSLAQWLIGACGWRLAYVGLALLLLVVTLPVTLLLLRDDPASMGLRPDGAFDPSRPVAQAQPVPGPGDGRRLDGLTAREALRDPTFWLVAVAFGLAGFAITGPTLHFVALLTDRGVSPQTAAFAQSLSGLALLVGRVAAGHLMDRCFAPRVAIAFLLAPLAALVLLASGAGGAVALGCGALLGLALGAEVDVIAFLTGRYFGLRAYGTIYGLQFAAFSAAAGLAPTVTALGYDATGSYRSVLAAFAVVLVVAIALLTRLGPYRRWDGLRSP